MAASETRTRVLVAIPGVILALGAIWLGGWFLAALLAVCAALTARELYRMAARKGRTAEMREIFEAHLAEPAAQLQLAQAIEIAKGRKAALLCYEADHRGCHRSIVVEHMLEAADFAVENLEPSTL